MVTSKNEDSNELTSVFLGGGSDLSMTYPQQIQLFSNTDGRLDTANVLSVENAFNFFFYFPMLCLQLYICL